MRNANTRDANREDVSEERKGFLTTGQEQKLDDLIDLSGIKERFDGVAIALLDNVVMSRIKRKYINDPEVLQDVYRIIDMIFDAIPEDYVK